MAAAVTQALGSMRRAMARRVVDGARAFSAAAGTSVAEGDVVVKVFAAPLGHSTAVGQIAEVGAGEAASAFEKDEWVVHSLAPSDNWESTAVASAASLTRVPLTVPIEQAAMLTHSTSVALRLLNDFGELSAGDVIMNVGADGPVGQAIVQVAASRGVRTINVVRGDSDYSQTVEHLYSIGADLVVADSYVGSDGYFTAAKDIGDSPKLVLSSAALPNKAILDPLRKAKGKISALRAIYEDMEESGDLARVKGSKDMLAAMGDAKTVTYDDGAETGDHTFSMQAWLESSSLEDRQALLDEAARVTVEDQVYTFVKTISPEEMEFFGRESVAHETNRSVVVIG
eukprot:g1771.t1